MRTQVRAQRSAKTRIVEDDGVNVAERKAKKGKPSEPPVINLPGLEFFIADAVTKQIMWLENGSLAIDGQGGRMQEATFADAMRLLIPQDQKSVLSLINGAIKNGKAGPIQIGNGADGSLTGTPLASFAYDADGGRTFVVCYPVMPSTLEDTGSIVRGVAPVIRHFVENTSRIALTIDNYGYIRYASPGFFKVFEIEDAALCMGRNISHISTRLGRTLVTLLTSSLARRANATGSGRFTLPSGDKISLEYSVIYFRISETISGVMFTGDFAQSGTVDLGKVFDLVTTPIMLVDTKTRMMVAVNKAARVGYHLQQQVIDEQPITDALLHPRTYSTLLEAAKKRNAAPQNVVINCLDGVSLNKVMVSSLLEVEGETGKLVLEERVTPPAKPGKS